MDSLIVEFQNDFYLSQIKNDKFWNLLRDKVKESNYVKNYIKLILDATKGKIKGEVKTNIKKNR